MGRTRSLPSLAAQTSIGPNFDGPNWTSILEGLSLNFFLSRRRGFRLLLAASSRAVPLSLQLQREPRGGGGERGVSSPSMATTTAPEDAPSAAKGAKGEAKRKQSNWRGGGGEGGQGHKRKRKEVFVYGNYRNYYGYRVSEHPPLPLSLLLRGAQIVAVCMSAPTVRWNASMVVAVFVGLGWFMALDWNAELISVGAPPRMYLSYSGVISDLICCGLQ